MSVAASAADATACVGAAAGIACRWCRLPQLMSLLMGAAADIPVRVPPFPVSVVYWDVMYFGTFIGGIWAHVWVMYGVFVWNVIRFGYLVQHCGIVNYKLTVEVQLQPQWRCASPVGYLASRAEGLAQCWTYKCMLRNGVEDQS